MQKKVVEKVVVDDDVDEIKTSEQMKNLNTKINGDFIFILFSQLGLGSYFARSPLSLGGGIRWSIEKLCCHCCEAFKSSGRRRRKKKQKGNKWHPSAVPFACQFLCATTAKWKKNKKKKRNRDEVSEVCANSFIFFVLPSFRS